MRGHRNRTPTEEMCCLKCFGQFQLFSCDFLRMPLFIICSMIELLIKVGLGTTGIQKRPESLPGKFRALDLDVKRHTYIT